MVSRFHNIGRKHLYRFFFMMNVQRQTVHHGIVVIGFDEVQRNTIVGCFKGTNRFRGKGFSLRRQLPEQTLW